MRLTLTLSTLLTLLPQILASQNVIIHAPGDINTPGTLCLDVWGNAQSNGTLVRMYEINKTTAQFWNIPTTDEVATDDQFGIQLTSNNALSVHAGTDKSVLMLNDPDGQGWVYDLPTKRILNECDPHLNTNQMWELT
ncbi:hypothetical protein DXG01_005838 [Tephrocybe rancida]|nr:hypothetical protein DXG01_005838 [Tephrocybe rancida]